MQRTSLPLLLGKHWLGVVEPDGVLSVGQIGLFNILLEIELYDLLTACIYEICLQIVYLMYM